MSFLVKFRRISIRVIMVKDKWIKIVWHTEAVLWAHKEKTTKSVNVITRSTDTLLIVPKEITIGLSASIAFKNVNQSEYALGL